MVHKTESGRRHAGLDRPQVQQRVFGSCGSQCADTHGVHHARQICMRLKESSPRMSLHHKRNEDIMYDKRGADAHVASTGLGLQTLQLCKPYISAVTGKRQFDVETIQHPGQPEKLGRVVPVDSWCSCKQDAFQREAGNHIYQEP